MKRVPEENESQAAGSSGWSAWSPFALPGVGAYVYSLYTPKQVMIAINDDPPITVEVSGWTVGHALKAAGIAVYEGDEVSPSLTGRITRAAASPSPAGHR